MSHAASDLDAASQARIAAIVEAVLAEFGHGDNALRASVHSDLAADAPRPSRAEAAEAQAESDPPHDDLQRPIPTLQIESPKDRGVAAAAAPDGAQAHSPASAVAPRPGVGTFAYRRARHAADGLPFAPSEVARLRAATPARIVQGRSGTRYPTDKAIGLRAEHAVALDAVLSTLPDGFAQALGCLELRTDAADHADYLAFPEKGRRLCAASRALLEQGGTRGADVQIICGDGLAAWALEANAPTLLPALQQELAAAGFGLGIPLLVHHARVGVQDEIGVVLGCKATLILVGERPGLGTGDSLSVYTAFAPRIGQDNAEKDCISNIRPLGVPPAEAAKMTAELLRRTFAAGGGGVHLTSQTDAA